MLTRRELVVAAAGAAGAHVLGVAPASGRTRASSHAFVLALDAPDARAAAVGWTVLPARRAARDFVLAGVRWDDEEGPDAVELRTRRGDGRWSRWAPAPIHPGHGPDRRPARATDPVWTGAADQVQVRVRGRAGGLRAALVAARPPAARARAAQAAPGPPAVIPRAAWGGDTVTPRDAPQLGEVQVAFVHHTVNANDYDPEESATMVLAIARYHRDVNGWDDLGYNFLVDRHGQVFEGRAGGMDQAVVGAQVQGFNHLSTGIACLGTFGEDALPPAAGEALATTIAWKLGVHGTPVSGTVTVRSRGGSQNRFPAGTDVVLARISGHRDGGMTECPGAALHGQLPAIRARAATLSGTMPGTATATPPLRARLGSQRVRSRGKGVLVAGAGAEPGPLSVTVDRQDRALRFRFARRIRTHAETDGSFAVRVRLPRPGVYRLTVRSAGQRVPLVVRSVRR